MSERAPATTKNLDSNNYGLAPLEWGRIRDHLAADLPRMTTGSFLGTVGDGGRPHAAGIGPIYWDGDVYFTSSPRARKARHIAANPNVSLAMRLEGVDVVIEGTAARVTDRPTLDAVLRVFVESGWPAELDADGDAFTAPFSAPSAGPPPWHVYRVTAETVFAVASEEPHGATRWTFER